MNQEKIVKKFNKELIPKLKYLAQNLIDQSRNHLLQICLISGVISAFLIPLFTATIFSPAQHFFIALSLMCFLLTILTGMLYLSFKLFDEQKNINEMIDIMQQEDFNRGDAFYQKHSTPLRELNSIDIKTLMVDILFAGGIICLIIVIFLNEAGWFYFKN